MVFVASICLSALCAFAEARELNYVRSKRAVAAVSNSTSGQYVVSTNVGTFQGHPAAAGSTVREWLGVRYGQPTNGTLRFRPPQRAKVLPADQVFQASTYSPSCPQNRGSAYQGFNFITPLGNATDGEDCLSVNIWAPSVDRLNSSSAGTAVMVWIYGGAFTFGTSNTPGYQGDAIVRDNDDVTVVSLNYRTNAFGFPAGASALTPFETNLGLKDQRLAIEWVYNNIRAFGGDPSRIILFGESAGASSIGAYPYTYASDPIVTGLIMESGSEYLMASEAVANQTLADEGWNYLASQVGCSMSTTANTTAGVEMIAGLAQLECMQNVSFTSIQQAVSNYSGSTVAFQPRPDNISVLTAAQYSAASSAELFAKLPILIGTNDNEGSILTALTPGISPDALTLYGFTCPAAAVATSRQNASVPSWQYRYLGMWPDINPIPALGVYHSSEIGLVFGTYNISTIAPPTAQEIAFSHEMQGGWVAFAKDPVNGLKQYGWPVYEASGTTLIQLGQNNMSMTTFNNSQAYNTGCAGVPLV